MNRLSYIKCLQVVILILSLGGCAVLGGGSHINNKASSNSSPVEKKDTLDKPKPYKEIITEEAITDDGLFKVHHIDDRWFFQISDSLMNRDILIVSRINKAATQQYSDNRLYNGDEINKNTVKFVKGPHNKVFLKLISYNIQSQDSTKNGLYQAVKNSNLQPIIESFDIKAISPDSPGVIIDITDFISTENNILFFQDELKKTVGLENLQKEKSYIKEVKSFPLNVEIRTVKTYGSSGGAFSEAAYTYELNNSFVLLPKEPMKPRYRDPRVGYFGTSYIDYDINSQGVKSEVMINRWNLEPKAEDVEQYKRGELVEPKNPIIYYIDPATPEKWIPYLIQGVNDWQKAFEQAGFKNAIMAKRAPLPEVDSTWSLQDARHSAIIYKASQTPNASGPNIHDPRSGEILETHINWYHNVMKLAHDWYMIQAGAVDPGARKMTFDKELMGRLIRFVCAHEVGHTLGLQHNFGASSTVPTDSLRSKTWLENNGHTPSIMDYARFNYVAQPEDNISREGLMPHIGVYDKWAIEWGYRWLPELKTPKQKKDYMNKWITERTQDDKRLWFGAMPFYYGQDDPRRQAEDLGNDAIKSSHYGIKNLKRIMPQLIEWTKEPNTSYDAWDAMQLKASYQFLGYMYNVVKIVGGIKWTKKFRNESGPQHEFIPYERQKEAVAFIQEQLFSKPLDWLFEVDGDKTIYSYSLRSQSWNTLLFQKRILQELMSLRKILRLYRIEREWPAQKTYTTKELLEDLKSGIWNGLKSGKVISEFKRNLQKMYVEQLVLMAHPRETQRKSLALLMHDIKFYGGYAANTDIFSIIKGHKQLLIEEIDTAIPAYKDSISKLHLEDVKDRLKHSIRTTQNSDKIFVQPTINSFNDSDLVNEPRKINRQNCWMDKIERLKLPATISWGVEFSKHR